MERSFPHTLDQLRHHHQANHLFSAVENLLMHAQQSPSTEALHLFNESPTLTQAVWKGEKTDSIYHRDALGISVFKDGLIVGIHPADTSQFRRHIAMGFDYANYSEQAITRPGGYDKPLDIERLEHFSEHFEAMTARLGLASIAFLHKAA